MLGQAKLPYTSCNPSCIQGIFDIYFFNSGDACHINHRELAMVAPLLGLHKLYDDAGHVNSKRIKLLSKAFFVLIWSPNLG